MLELRLCFLFTLYIGTEIVNSLAHVLLLLLCVLELQVKLFLGFAALPLRLCEVRLSHAKCCFVLLNHIVCLCTCGCRVVELVLELGNPLVQVGQ